MIPINFAIEVVITGMYFIHSACCIPRWWGGRKAPGRQSQRGQSGTDRSRTTNGHRSNRTLCSHTGQGKDYSVPGLRRYIRKCTADVELMLIIIIEKITAFNWKSKGERKKSRPKDITSSQQVEPYLLNI